WPSTPRVRGVTPVGAAAGLADAADTSAIMALLSELVAVNGRQHSVAPASGADLGAATFDGLLVAPEAIRPLGGRERVLPQQAELIAQHVAALRRLDDRHGGGALNMRYVGNELRGVLDLVETARCEPAVRRSLLATVSDLAQLLGWLRFDGGEYGAAQRYLLLSIRVARRGHDDGRAANSIGMLSYVGAFAGHGGEAIDIANAAARHCHNQPALQARIVGRLATAHAAAGNLAGFQAASDTARELLGRPHSGDAPPYLYYLEPEQLIAEAGQGLVTLAAHAPVYRKRLLKDAINLLTPISIASARPNYPRAALLHSCFLIDAHLGRGDLDGAVAATREALPRLEQVQ
ncbi:MAG: hypothetical protein ACRDJ9_35815, partial [Dehalococcoidia bacterium]